MRQQLTLQTLILAFAQTQKRATPHRTPDFERILKHVDGDPEVRGKFWLIEESNTGYAGVLHRWEFFVPNKDGGKISFWADLLPDLVFTETSPLIPPEATPHA